VDGHRSEALVISPYTRRGGIVDSTLYTTVNMFRTIEHVLGLAPLNQFDRAAITMTKTFSRKPDLTPFDALPNQIPLDEMNPSVAAIQGLQRELALASLQMDFSGPRCRARGRVEPRHLAFGQGLRYPVSHPHAVVTHGHPGAFVYPRAPEAGSRTAAELRLLTQPLRLQPEGMRAPALAASSRPAQGDRMAGTRCGFSPTTG
jgi:hypothetical protein